MTTLLKYTNSLGLVRIADILEYVQSPSGREMLRIMWRPWPEMAAYIKQKGKTTDRDQYMLSAHECTVYAPGHDPYSSDGSSSVLIAGPGEAEGGRHEIHD